MKKRLVSNQRANAGMIFALISALMVTTLGASVDLANISSNKAKAQAALDAALMYPFGSETYHDSINEVNSLVNKSLAGAKISSSLTMGNALVTKTATGYRAVANYNIALIFGGIIGKSSMAGEVVSEIGVGQANLEVAFVLDTSGSMEGARITELRGGVQNTLSRLQSLSARFLSLKAAIVPFSNTVNIGAANASASYMDTNALSPIHGNIFSNPNINRFSLFNHLGENWLGCVQSRPAPFDVDDTAPSGANGSTLFVPWLWPDEPDPDGFVNNPNSYLTDDISGDSIASAQSFGKYGIVNPTNPATWTPVTKSAPYAFYSNMFEPQGPNFGCWTQELMPLTANIPATSAKAGSLVAKGGTNLIEGLAWGWRVLSPTQPFAEALPYGTGNLKVMVFFTDGSNAVNAYSSALQSDFSSYGYGHEGNIGPTPATSASIKTFMDGRTAQVCENIKHAGITIYTIGLAIDNPASENILRNCASEPSKFFSIQTASEIDGAFDKIAMGLMKLHLSK